ncbi:hypothetical protein DC498_07985 [Terrimonas sp.]|uniref:hypothetical protein n=1 Tax=Terrimonas sp. TaxID=1914338 RepID=UPI000D51917E|nr:hypothetical protein [Terrimonas sp.]PVD52854.1 hypothetical protein DC498_07985 [Terrimonas sp.]
MPFSTAVYSEYSTEEHIHLIAPYAVYIMNICFTGVMSYVLLNYICNEKNGILSLFLIKAPGCGKAENHGNTGSIPDFITAHLGMA